ncbi:MAG: glycerate-2-kinase family protein, partial [Gammaproteobacteria bacterium]
MQSKTLLLQAWRAGVLAVGGERVTRAALAAERAEAATHLLAVGKAAGAMCAGAIDAPAAGGRALVVSKYGHIDARLAAHPRVTTLEAGHPLPDENSLRAGRAMAEFVGAAGAGARLVMLVSGGASALAEVLPAGVELPALRRLNRALLAGGYDIAQINAARMRVSGIKGGRLLRRFGGASVRVYAISDVRADDVALIGGGVGGLGGVG